MGFVESVKEIAEKVGDTVDKGIKTGSDSYKKMTEKSRLKRDVTRLTNEMNNIYIGVGKKVFADEPDSQKFRSQFDNIREKEREIERLNALINELENKTPCPQCGEPVAKDAHFCDKCGAKIVRPENEPKAENVEAEKITICRKCGAELVDAARFCDKCGAKLTD